MKIIAMLNGGGMPPFVYYQPVMTNNQQPSVVSSNTSSQKDTTESEKGALGDKDLMSMLSKIDGLPVDMDVIFKKINHFYRLLSAGINTRSLALTYLTAMKELKEAKYNKEQFKIAQERAIKLDGLNETAIGTNGELYFVDNNKNISRVSMALYMNNKEEFQKNGLVPLTNHLLLQYRASHPSLAMNNELFTTVTNGIGPQYINQLIKAATESLGNNTYEQTGYVAKLLQLVLKGVEVLLSAAKEAIKHGKLDELHAGLSIDGLYKLKYMTADLARQAEYAMKYIYLALPDNAKRYLMFKAGSEDGATQFVMNSVLRGISTKYTFDPDLLLDSNGNKPDTKKGGNEEDGNSTDPAQFPKSYYFFTHGYGDSDSFKLLPVGSTESLNVTAISSPLTDDDGKNVGTLNLTLQQVGASSYGGYLDMNKASAAGQRIDNTYADKILINDDKIYMVALPYIKDNKTGIIMPNYDLLPKITKINKELLSQGINVNNHDDAIRNKEKINEAYMIAGLPAFIDENGELNAIQYQKFAMVNGYVYDKALGLNLKESDEELLLAYGKDIEDDDTLHAIVNKVNHLNGHESKSSGFELYFDYNNWFDINGHDHYYLTNIYIPIKNNPTNFMTGGDNKIKEDAFGVIRKRDVISQVQSQMQQTRPYVNPNDL